MAIVHPCKMINHQHLSGVDACYREMTKFGKLTFGDLTFGEMTKFGDLTFGEVTFGEMA